MEKFKKGALEEMKGAIEEMEKMGELLKNNLCSIEEVYEKTTDNIDKIYTISELSMKKVFSYGIIIIFINFMLLIANLFISYSVYNNI